MKWTAWPVCMAVLLVGGCAVLPRHVTFVRGNVQCDGLQSDLFSATRYSTVWVGTPREPYAGSPRLTLRFPDGTTVQSDRLSAGWLTVRADRSAPRRAGSLLVEQGWPGGSEELSVGGFRFVVQGDRVLGFGIGPEPPPELLTPGLGDASGAVFLRPPFRERDLTALFGRPDSVRKQLAGGPP